MELERAIAELAQLMTDFATLIDLQQDNLDSIEANVAECKEFVTVAVEELRVANMYAKRARGKTVTIVGGGIAAGAAALA